MKENSIEEDIGILDHIIMGIKADTKAPNVNTRNVAIRKIKAIEHILDDYKRVLEENKELLQEKINNQKIIVLAQNDMLNYQAGFEDGKNGRTSAVQSIIENQQYYIFQKQIEKYERHIEKLQKENKLFKHRLEVADDFIESRQENLIPENYDDLKYIINECDLESTW